MSLIALLLLSDCAAVERRVISDEHAIPPRYLRVATLFCFLSRCTGVVDKLADADIIYMRCVLANCAEKFVPPVVVPPLSSAEASPP